MPTDVIKKIGKTNSPTTMDYTSLAAWAAACPTNLVTADQRWIGEVYNQGELDIGTTQLTMSPTTDATRYVILRAATGASFKDNASAATNPLRYNASVGAAITGNYAYDQAFIFTCDMEISGLQFRNSAGSGQGVIKQSGNSVGRVHECIISQGSFRTPNNIGLWFNSGAAAAAVGTNVLVISENLAANVGITLLAGGTLTNCTIIGHIVSIAINYGNASLSNCALFNAGATSPHAVNSTQRTISGANNATDQSTLINWTASPGTDATTGTLTSVAYSTATFDAISGVKFGTGTGFDFRIPTGSALKNAGSNANGSSIDILGVSRPQGGTSDIGAYEFPAAAAPAADAFLFHAAF